MFLNFALDTSEWIFQVKENACTTWDGLCLSQPINVEKRQLIKKNDCSLLDFRNYLFSRQCTLLFLMFRPWEVAQRSIQFMHNCIKELDMLEVSSRMQINTLHGIRFPEHGISVMRNGLNLV